MAKQTQGAEAQQETKTEVAKNAIISVQKHANFKGEWSYYLWIENEHGKEYVAIGEKNYEKFKKMSE